MTQSISSSDNWEAADWKEFQKVLFRLQRRIFKAVRDGDKAKAKRLQKLVLSSHSARMLAIRQVTQLNTGKKTAGIDGKKSLTFKERFQLEETLKQNTKTWKHQGLRKIPIPKKDGTKRILKVPTIADRAWQCLVKYALEPAHEAEFHERSYGFRPGRGTHDAQKILQINLRSNRNGINKRILEIDIEKCFDRISHKAILDKTIAPEFIIGGLRRCLKSGINPQFPNQGTPQGGVASPLLANIALNGIEKIGEYKLRGKTISKCIRYADDMVFILKPEDSAEKILAKIEEFLAERGMNVSQKKTKVTASTDGFNFLGWNFYVQKNNGKFRSTPSEDNFKAFRQKVKHIVNNSNYGAETKVSKLAPVVRGWRNYHKYCHMDSSRFSLWHLAKRTFTVFLKQKTINKHQAEKMVKTAFPSVNYSENKFVNVKGKKSPFDADINYWSKRNSVFYDGATARTLRKQSHSCGQCGLKFLEGEKVELHHIDGNHNNWDEKNLLAIHSSCHHYVHMGKSRKDSRYSGAQCGETPARCDLTERCEGLYPPSTQPAVFESNSYGFRCGRSCQDAIEQNFLRVHKGRDTWVLEADIKGFFDNIAHEAILKQLGNFPKRNLIKGWLKAGFIFEGKYNPTETGTPQGGSCSPLLANIGLHGLETIIKTTNPKLGVVRYADDVIVTARDKGSLETAQIQIQQWLSNRGLELSAEKTLITSMEDGFDFLGFNHRHYNGKLLIKPSKKKVLDFCKRIGKEIKAMNGIEQEAVIRKLNPILRGFANYYKGVVSKETFGYISSRIWQYLWRWAKRRHSNKGKRWIRERYFKTYKGNNWTFACNTSNRERKEKLLVLYPIAYTSIERHIKVKGNASPDDPYLKEYWKKRHQKHGKSYWERNSRNFNIAQNQNWKCPICGEPLFNGEEIETHHIIPVAQGGQDDIENLQHLHKPCHKQEHSKSKTNRLK